ncbi:MAG: hypothetical protein E6J90_41430 [Deltaproteobacteria bacterium]|nr:MAG: hypothetical protein E6J90_41430 [Deltaproteobacteria bacterium]
MVSITACRERISDRFPVASFVVKVPPDRLFEIACATDPRLFATENRERRTPANFSTSRSSGLMRAPAGEATYLVPPDQLRRFAGARRLYYAVAAYRTPQGQDPVLTLSRDRLDQVPSIQIAADFTGKTLDRGRLSRDPAPQRYGGAPAAPIMWGGDLVTSPAASAAGAGRIGGAATDDYDDGFDAKLWREDQRREDQRMERADDDRADRAHDPDRYGSPGGDLAGWEDGPALSAAAAELAGPARPARRFGDGDDAPPNCWALPPDAVLVAAAPVVEAPELYGGRTGRADEGYEDAPDLARNLGPERLRFGAPRARPRAGAFGRFPGYSEADVAADPLPAARPISTLPPGFDPTDPRQRLRILHRVAVAESGADTYRAVNPDREYEDPELTELYHRRHVGLSWGFIQFAQRYGSLGQVLSACNRRDPAAFRTTFGAHNGADPAADPSTLAAGHLLRVTNAPAEDDRLAPVQPPAGGGAVVLWDPAWVTAFQAAGGLRPFQEAQREVADRRYYEPYLDFLGWLGFDSVRAQAMFVDRTIHMGGGAAMQWIMSVVGPIQSQSDLAGALDRLDVPDLRTFQMSPPPGATRWLGVDGVFGPRTHAALVWALRQLGDPTMHLPALDEMLAALCDDAARRADLAKSWKLAAQRLRALKDDPTLDRVPPEPRGDEAGSR